MSIWKQLYQAYQEKNCQKFENLWKQLTKEDKSSPYFSYYASLKAKLCPQQNKKWKILLKWKVIKCPSCWAPLTLSDYNKEQIKKLKDWTIQVTFICNFCWNKFSYSKTPFKSIFSNYSIWDEVKINWKKYKLAWAVKYKWTYNETWEWTWRLEYIEWLAYDKKWEVYYISESRSKDFYWTYDEFEVSKKVNFPFVIQDISYSEIETNKWIEQIDETDEVKVISLIWELNKSYKIWEKVKLWKFQNYNLEEETRNNYIERNLYKNVFVKEFWDNTRIKYDMQEIEYNNYIIKAVLTILLFLFLFYILFNIFIVNFMKSIVSSLPSSSWGYYSSSSLSSSSSSYSSSSYSSRGSTSYWWGK